MDASYVTGLHLPSAPDSSIGNGTGSTADGCPAEERKEKRCINNQVHKADT